MGGGASTYDRDVTDSSAKTFKPEDVIGMPPGPDTETWRVRRCDAQPPGQMSALISPPAPGVCMRGDRMETNTKLFSSQARIESRCSTRAGKKRLNLLCTAIGNAVTPSVVYAGPRRGMVVRGKPVKGQCENRNYLFCGPEFGYLPMSDAEGNVRASLPS